MIFDKLRQKLVNDDKQKILRKKEYEVLCNKRLEEIKVKQSKTIEAKKKWSEENPQEAIKLKTENDDKSRKTNEIISDIRQKQYKQARSHLCTEAEKEELENWIYERQKYHR